MIFDAKGFARMDTRCFKAFMAAATTENFTTAADIAAMTQSGVSQKVRKLEEQIEAPLFYRDGKNVRLTSIGIKLKRHIEQYLIHLDCFFNDISSVEFVTGRIKCGIPHTSSQYPGLARILKRFSRYHRVTCQLLLGTNEQNVQQLIEQELDFAIVTHQVAHHSLVYNALAKEHYLLVSGLPMVAGSSLDLMQLKWIRFPGSDGIYSHWFKHSTYADQRIDYRSLEYSCDVDSVEIARDMVASQLGVGIFPTYVIKDYLKQKKIFANQSPSMKVSAPVYTAYSKYSPNCKLAKTIVSKVF